MKVTHVTVTVHEKRNHPHEYGHYDCEVMLSADVEPDEDEALAAEVLRETAREQVQAECDQWIAGIEEQRQIEQIVSDIRYACNALRHRLYPESHTDAIHYAKQAWRQIKQLPEERRSKWRDELREAIQAFRDRQGNGLEELDPFETEDLPF